MSKETATENPADEIAITRVFDAPRDLVFQAWTEPKHFAAWFGGPQATVPLETTSMDARPGGGWTVTMLKAGPEGADLTFYGEFVEVVRPERLVLTMADRPGDARELITVTFTDLGGKTEMAFRQTGGNLSAAEYAAAKEGWATFFGALADLLQPA
jgi:uncharacterized protein YndB with AHSA1/START domain